MKLDQRLAQALANLRANPDFRVFMEVLKEDELAETQRCIECDGVALHRAQGSVKKLQELQAHYVNAPSTLSKLRHQTG